MFLLSRKCETSLRQMENVSLSSDMYRYLNANFDIEYIEIHPP
jgi:hypothetical protein